jgi:centromere/kinetochore protein ZW10
MTPLSDSFIPAISSKIISHWLSTAIPTKLADLSEFEATLDHVLQFTNTIESLNLHGQEELVSWTTQAPRLWLTRRRVDSLDQVRKVLAASKGDSRQVERIERRQVSETDEVLLDNSTSDDWDAGWDDEKENAQNNDEEDVSAWGLDDDTDEPKVTKANDASGVDDDETGDAWGWGEDDEDEDQAAAEYPQNGNTTAEPVRANEDRSDAISKEITLREYYTITDVPDSILQIIRQQISDFEIISKPSYVLTDSNRLVSTNNNGRHSSTLVSSSGAGLLAIPTLILAMFKAVAPAFYGLKLNAGQMYLYNDSLYLADQVRQVANNHQLSRLDGDIEALEKFGKLAYSKEMQTQRTIVTDLLDGAQGFSQCSEQPFLGDCENAVRATVDRLRTVYKEWQPILSHSALLQAIGSLVSTVAEKIIIDIEDLGDISESQSRKLVSFCNQLSNLEDLFLPEHSDDAKPVPMTAVYVRNWLKFQYLINILESSLADIKFLWLEGELSLEFSADEVVDLIEALFAESDHRRRAIAEIKRVSRG